MPELTKDDQRLWDWGYRVGREGLSNPNPFDSTNNEDRWEIWDNGHYWGCNDRKRACIADQQAEDEATYQREIKL